MKNNQSKSVIFILILLALIFYPLSRNQTIYPEQDFPSVSTRSLVSLNQVYHDNLQRGTIPFYSPTNNLGEPLLPHSEYGFFNPLRFLLFSYFTPNVAHHLLVFCNLFLSAIGVMFLLSLYTQALLPTIAGLSLWILSSPVILYLADENTLTLGVFAPLIIYFLSKSTEDNSTLDLCFAALFTGLLLLSAPWSHLPVIFLVLLTFGLFFNQSFKFSLSFFRQRLLFFLLPALLISAPALLSHFFLTPTIATPNLSHTSSQLLPVVNSLLTFLSPWSLESGVSTNLQQFPAWTGIISLVFVFLTINSQIPRIVPWQFLCIVSFLSSIAVNFSPWFLESVPLISSGLLLLYCLSVVVLAAISLDNLNLFRFGKRRKYFIALSFLALFTLFFPLLLESLFSPNFRETLLLSEETTHFTEYSQTHGFKDFLFLFLPALIPFSLLLMVITDLRSEKLLSAVTVLLLIELLPAALWMVPTQKVIDSNDHRDYEQAELLKQVSQELRIIPALEYIQSGEQFRLPKGISRILPNTEIGDKILNILKMTDSVALHDKLAHEFGVGLILNKNQEATYHDSSLQLTPTTATQTIPKAEFFYQVVDQNSLEGQLNQMKEGTISALGYTLNNPTQNSNQRITTLDSNDNRYNFVVSTEQKGFLLLKHFLTADFVAKIDGEPVQIYQSGTVFSGIAVPAGEHEVLFEYHSNYLFSGFLLMILGLLLILLQLLMTSLDSFRAKIL